MSKPGPSHLETDRPCSAYPKGCGRCRFRLFCFLASRNPRGDSPGAGKDSITLPGFCMFV